MGLSMKLRCSQAMDGVAGGRAASDGGECSTGAVVRWPRPRDRTRQVPHRHDPGHGLSRAERADNKLAEFRTQVFKPRSPESAVGFGFVLDEWLRTVDIETSTRDGYIGYVDRIVRPALGDVPVNKVGVRDLESCYAELRRCRIRCDGKPFVVHNKDGEHDCIDEKCKLHECNPIAQSTVRQIHSIMSRAMNAAVSNGACTTIVR
jgi:hypothetical protein